MSGLTSTTISLLTLSLTTVTVTCFLLPLVVTSPIVVLASLGIFFTFSKIAFLSLSLVTFPLSTLIKASPSCFSSLNVPLRAFCAFCKSCKAFATLSSVEFCLVFSVSASFNFSSNSLRLFSSEFL